MKVSLQLIKQYTEVKLSTDELIKAIGAQLGAVEAVLDMRGKYAGIQIVQITEARDHPNADKLNIYQMTNGREQIQVVSGDRSLQVGDKVAWIAPGQTIPSTWNTPQPIVMEARPLRGEMSHGMFGSGKELDINDDHQGVLKLDTSAHPGTLLAEVYQLEDIIIDIENKMFTHRPDCFGLLGVAREIAGIQHKAFTSPDWYLLEAGKLLQAETDHLPLEVHNQIPALCPVYQVAVMRQITVGPSPLLLQSYLKRVGIRPINNVVDVTNWLMYLTGQPLHAFDYDKLAALDGQMHAAITVRHPKENETITLLDGKSVRPHKEAILICSRHHPIAIGGVMGGQATEVDEHTKTIIIESANFNMYSIRKTAFAHGLFTDAVTRFGKGQSPEQCGMVLAEAVILMQQYSGAVLANELGIEQPLRMEPVAVDVAKVNKLLGATITSTAIRRLLENVEITVHVAGDSLEVSPPFWRTDLEIPEDIVEEIGRLYGFARLPHELPTRSIAAVSLPSLELLKNDIRSVLALAGNNELQTYSFVHEQLLSKAGQDSKPAYRLRNALSPDLQVVRTSVLPSLLDKVHANHKAGYDTFGLFEIGKSHNKYDTIHDPGAPDHGLPRERLSVAYVTSAEGKAAAAQSENTFYQAKYQLEFLCKQLHILQVAYVPLAEAQLANWWLQNQALLFEAKRAAAVMMSGVCVGIVGEFTTHVQMAFKLPAQAAGFELDIVAMHGLDRPACLYRPASRYPVTEQDISLRVATAINYKQLETAILHHFAADHRLTVTVSPVDIYQKSSTDSHKHLTYRLRLQHYDRTLTTTEVNSMLQKLAESLQRAFAAERL